MIKIYNRFNGSKLMKEFDLAFWEENKERRINLCRRLSR